MKLINITFAVSPAISAEFTEHITSVLIPKLTEAGYYNPLLSKVCPVEDPAPDDDTVSFALQMRAPSAEIHDSYMNKLAPEHLGAIVRRWANCVALFITELDVVFDPAKDNGRSC